MTHSVSLHKQSRKQGQSVGEVWEAFFSPLYKPLTVYAKQTVLVDLRMVPTNSKVFFVQFMTL